MGFDRAILYYLQSIHNPPLDAFMIFLTRLGNSGIIWIAVILFLLANRSTRRGAAAAALALLLETVICMLIIKPLVARPRPYMMDGSVTLLIPKLRDFSFPSGHTGSGFAVVTALLFSKTKIFEKFPLWIPLGVLAALIAVSRLYLFVHYPTDVLAGAAFGILFGYLSVRILNSFENHRSQRNAGSLS